MSSKSPLCPSKVDYLSEYNLKGILGKGTFSIVRLGENKITKEKVAIKIMQKNKILNKDDFIRIQREIEILKRLKHPNVIKIHHIFEDEKKIYIIMEFCENGELFNRIVEKKSLTENEAALFYYQLINGLEYIHKNGIVHRDLKPENLLLSKNDLLKVIDFGLSNYSEENKLLFTPCGSPCYASPEMVSGQRYDGCMIDIWSTGIILFAMVCGYLPFEDNDNDILFGKILKCKIHYPKSMGALTLDLMKKIIVPEPKQRITLEQIKLHDFYLKGKYLFSIKYPELVDEIEGNNNNKSVNKNEIISNNIHSIKNVEPIVNNNIMKNIKEYKEKNIININNKYYQSHSIDITNTPNASPGFGKDVIEKGPKRNTQINTQIKENLINKFDSPSSLQSDEIPQDSVPVEASDRKKKIDNINIKKDLNKNFKEELKTMNLPDKTNIKTEKVKVYKINPRPQIEKEKEKLYMIKNKIVKDMKKINKDNKISAKSQINDRIIDDLYTFEKMRNTLENNMPATIANKMNYYNVNSINNIQHNKYSKDTSRIDKNNYLSNKTNAINKTNQNTYAKVSKINNTFSKRIQRKSIYGNNKMTDKNNKYNIENNMNLTNIEPNNIPIDTILDSYIYDKNKNVNEKNKDQNIKDIFNGFQIIQTENNNKTNFYNTNKNHTINLINNKTILNESNNKSPLMIGKTTTQINKREINNKKNINKYNNIMNTRDYINSDTNREYNNKTVRVKKLIMTQNNNNTIIINPTNTRNTEIYGNKIITNKLEGMNGINQKYFDTFTINNNNSINLHDPKLFIYIQNNNTINNTNNTNNTRLKSESNTNKTKIIFKIDNRKTNCIKNVNKINSVEYNKLVRGKKIKSNIIINKTIDNDANINRANKITPIKNKGIINNDKNINRNEKHIINRKLYNIIEPKNKTSPLQDKDIIFNNSRRTKDNNIKYISNKNNNMYFERNYFNNQNSKKINNNNNIIIQTSNLSNSLDKNNYAFQNLNDFVKTDGNISNIAIFDYNNESLTNTNANNNFLANNYINSNAQRKIKVEDINYNKTNFDNNDYRTRYQKIPMKNYINKENKNANYSVTKAENANSIDSLTHYRKINNIKTYTLKTPVTKQNYNNMINYRKYVK